MLAQTIVKKIENIVILALLVMMAIVVILAVIELGWILVKDIMKPPMFILEAQEFLDLFGVFLLVLIGLELLETIRAYHLDNVIRVEVVVTVAIIAIARKAIILDYKDLTRITLLDVGVVILALSAGYYLLKKGRFMRCEWFDPQTGSSAPTSESSDKDSAGSCRPVP